MEPTSSDSRRDLFEFEYPVSKLIRTKADCTLGKHFHKKKHEVFMLIAGSARVCLDGKWWRMIPFERFDVPPGTVHTFELTAGSVLLGYCSKPYDPSDDYKVE